MKNDFGTNSQESFGFREYPDQIQASLSPFQLEKSQIT